MTTTDDTDVHRFIIDTLNLNCYNNHMIKKVVKKNNLKTYSEIKDNLAYWLSKPTTERISAVEFLRRQFYGSSTRLQRLARVIQRP